jgi:hypothetical protein
MRLRPDARNALRALKARPCCQHDAAHDDHDEAQIPKFIALSG